MMFKSCLGRCPLSVERSFIYSAVDVLKVGLTGTIATTVSILTETLGSRRWNTTQ